MEPTAGTDRGEPPDKLEDHLASSVSDSEGRGESSKGPEISLPLWYTASQITPSIARRAATIGQSRWVRCQTSCPTIEFAGAGCAKCHAYILGVLQAKRQ